MNTVTNIANMVVEKVMVRLDGRDWQLIVTFNTLCELETLAKTNGFAATDIFKSIFVDRSPNLIRGLLYLCLRDQGAKYTLPEVGNLLNLKTLPLVLEGLVQSWMASMPKEDTEVEPGEVRAAV